MYENGKTADTCEAVPGKTVQGETLKDLIGKSIGIADDILELLSRMEMDLFGGEKSNVERPVVSCYRDATQYHLEQLMVAAKKLEIICGKVGV